MGLILFVLQLKELEHHGYVERHRLRNEYGFYGDTEYIIREVPLEKKMIKWRREVPKGG